jgi:hypothetical protein
MMQEENRFFRFLWRLNAIFLALAGVAIIVTVGISAIGMWWRPNPPDVPEGHFAPVPKSAEQKFTYRLEVQTNTVELPHEQIFALRRWNGSLESYGLARMSLADVAYSSSAHYTDAVNLLAVNTTTGASQWLFDGYRRAVIDQQPVYAGGPQAFNPMKPAAEPIALVIRAVDKDTNGDGKFDFQDGWSLYYHRPGEARAIKFFQANFILSMQEVDGGDFLVVYEKGKAAIAATFSVPDFKLKSEKPLPDVPQ